eukprot:7199252-Prymnesium_polylepis.1
MSAWQRVPAQVSSHTSIQRGVGARLEVGDSLDHGTGGRWALAAMPRFEHHGQHEAIADAELFRKAMLSATEEKVGPAETFRKAMLSAAEEK